MKKKDGRAPQKIKLKLAFIMVVIAIAFAVLLGRLLYWNLSKGTEFEKKVLTQQRYSSKELPFERGKIYDSQGKLIATNERIYTLVLEPKNILMKENDGTYKYKDATVEALETYMDISREEILSVLEANENSYYLEYKSELSYDDISAMKDFMELASKKKSEAKSKEEKEQIAKAELVTGVYFAESFQRVYPNDSAACHLIGFTSDGNVGQWGIERYYNDDLNGVNGRTYNYLNEDGKMESTTVEAVNGNSVVTTINLEIQKAIEARRQAFDTETGSKMTTITVMNPNNGEILGMTSSYDYDLNKPADESALSQLYSEAEIATFKENQEKQDNGEDIGREKSSDILTTIDAFSSIWKNSVISDTFEPGSTFKPFTVAAALEENLYDGTEGFYCPGYLLINKQKVGCSHVHDNIDFSDIIAKSCNTALMTIGLQEGKDTFTEYQRVFGFGEKTNIDLPGEPDTSTLLYSADNMTDLDLATNSFGQNFNVTALQMVSSFASLINGGYYYEPHVVKQVIGSDGNVIKNIGKTLLKTTISQEVSDQIKPLLENTVLKGTGKSAAIEGHSIGGKTGTAEKLTPVEKEDGSIRYVRNKEDYLVSFIAFTPADDPEILIYVTIDEPHVDYQANAGLAVELERQCMEDIIEILDIKED